MHIPVHSREARLTFFLACALFFFLPVGGHDSLYGKQAIPTIQTCRFSLWPHQQCDLQQNPQLVFGQLDNGFKYVLQKNREPKNRVVLNLLVGAGSINEEENERGVSHFLEHMMFNGSSNFPAGKLVAYFQSIGMNFGSDLNAFTSLDETVYKIILPDGSPTRLHDGLLVLADFASKALLNQSEIDKERGVIFSEKRSRDSARNRLSTAHNEFALAGSRLATRQPIGTEEVVQSVGEKELRQYYSKWYRPDNMILVVVGDVLPEDIEHLIKNTFGDLQTSPSPPDCPETGKLLAADSPRVFYFPEKDLGSLSISIESYWDTSPHPDSLSYEQEQLFLLIASRMFNYRLNKIPEQQNAPFVSAGFATGEIASRAGYSTLSARCVDDKWQQALDAIQVNLNQVLRYGFLPAELDRVKKEVLAELDKAIQTMETVDSDQLASQIIRDLRENRVSMSPVQEKELFAPILTKASIAEINAAFQKRWQQKNRIISLTGNISLPEADTKQQVVSRFSANEEQSVAAPTDLRTSTFPYLPEPPQALPVETQRIAALDSEEVRFANGLVVHLKKTDFEENSIRIRLDFGDGKVSEPKPGLAMLSEKVIAGSGTGSMKISELAEALSGTSVQTSFRVGEESFILEGSALNKDSERLFQLLYSLLVDPGFRNEAYERAMQGFEQMYKQTSHDIQGVYSLKAQPFFAGGHPQFGLPPFAALKELTLGEVQEWIRANFKNNRMELTITGQFDQQTIINLAGRYFGNIQATGAPARVPNNPTFPVGKILQASVDSAIDKALVTIAWPTDDYWDIHRTRRLQVLSHVVQNKLRESIREKLGATYSPSATHSANRVYQGFGVLSAQMTVESARTEEISTAILETVAHICTEGVSNDDLIQAKEPLLTTIRESVRTNTYWTYSVLALSNRHPQQLEWPSSLLDDYSAISADEITALARKYLRPERVAQAIIKPEK